MNIYRKVEFTVTLYVILAVAVTQLVLINYIVLQTETFLKSLVMI